MEIKSYEFDGVIVEEEIELSLEDLCRAYEVNTKWIIMLVDEGVLDPLNTNTDQWRFDGTSLRCVRIVRRLQ